MFMLVLMRRPSRSTRVPATALLRSDPGFGYSGEEVVVSSLFVFSSEIREFSECKKVVANILKIINFLKIFVLCFRMSGLFGLFACVGRASTDYC